MSYKPNMKSEMEHINAYELSLAEQSKQNIAGDKSPNNFFDGLKSQSELRNSPSPSPNILGKDLQDQVNVRRADEPMILEELTDKERKKAFTGFPSNQSELDQSVQAANQQKRQFNPSKFRFKKKDYNFKQEAFMQQFYEHNKANKLKINKMLVEQTYLQVLSRLEKEKKKGDFPQEFRENEMLWAGQMMRSKPLQKTMAEMTHKVAVILEEEMKNNRKLIGDWIKYPHSNSTSPTRNSIQLSQMDARIWYPETLPNNCKVTSARDRNRQTIAEASRKNQETRERKERERNVSNGEQQQQKLIHYRVLKGMHNNKPAAKPKKDKKAEEQKSGMTPFQEALHERLQSAAATLEGVENLNDEFTDELEDIANELRDNHRARAGKYPGKAITHMMQKWSDEPHHTPDQLNKYMFEPIMELEEIERYLKNQETGLQIELKEKEKQFRCRVDGVRNLAQMRIEALESALIETKISRARDCERAEMRLAEMESTMFNAAVKSDDNQRVDDILTAINDPTFHELTDQQKVYMMTSSIPRLQKCINSLTIEKMQTAKDLTEVRDEMAKNKELYQKSKDGVREWLNKLIYYQDAMYSIFERIGMVEDLEEYNKKSPISEEKFILLKEIFSLNAERLRQEEEMNRTHIRPDERKTLKRLEVFVNEFHEAIIEVDFVSVFEAYQEVVTQKTERIEQMANHFSQLGVIELDKLQHRKKTAEEEEALDQAKLLEAQPWRSSIRQGQQKSKKNKKVHTKEGLTISINEQRLSEIQAGFNDLTKPLAHAMNDMIREFEISTVSEADEPNERRRHGSKLGPEVDRYALTKKKGSTMKMDYIGKVQKKHQKLQEESDKRQRREARKNIKRGGGKNDDRYNSVPSENKLKAPRLSKDRYPSSMKQQADRERSSQPSQAQSRLRDKSRSQKREGDLSTGIQDQDDSSQQSPNALRPPKKNKKMMGSDAESKGLSQNDRVNSDANRDSSAGSSRQAGRKTDAAITIGAFGENDVSQRKEGKKNKSRDDNDNGEETGKSKGIDKLGSDEPDIESQRSEKHVSTKKITPIGDRDGSLNDLQLADQKRSEKTKTAKGGERSSNKLLQEKKNQKGSPKPKRPAGSRLAESQMPPTGKRNAGNTSNLPSTSTQKRGGSRIERVANSLENTAGSESQSRNRGKSKTKKIDRKVSVSIKMNREEHMQSQIVSGSDSDNADTEPIYRLREVIDELERKVLQKYKTEHEDVQNEPRKFFKLKAGHNRDMMMAFIQTLGEQLQDSEETQMTSTGNLDDMISLVNKLRDKYLMTSDGIRGIAVEKLSGYSRADSSDWKPIPMSDCILTQMSEDGTITNFSVRPEVMKIIMYRESGKDLSFVSKVIKTVNWLNRIFFRYDCEYNLRIKGQQEVSSNRQSGMTRRRESSSSSLSSPKLKNKSQPDLQMQSNPSLNEQPNIQPLMDLLKRHAAGIYAKGDARIQRFQTRVAKEQNFDELMGYKLNNVFEEIDEEDRADMSSMSSMGLTFYEYLQTLFEMIERKIRLLPKVNFEHLSVHDLVYHGKNSGGNDISSDNEEYARMEKEITKRVTAQLEAKFKAKLEKELNAKIKEFLAIKPVSRYSQQAIAAKKTMRNREAQTTDDLLEECLKQRADLSNNVAKEFINQQVAKEMNQTIETLYNFIDKLQKQNKEREEKEKKKRAIKPSGPLSLFKDPRQSIATNVSTQSPHTVESEMPKRMQPITAHDHRKAITSMIAQETNALDEERKQSSLKTAEHSINRRRAKARQQPHSVIDKPIGAVMTQLLPNSTRGNNQINFNMMLGQHLPRLGKEHHQTSMKSERNYSQTVTCEVSLMPQLHNSSTKASVLVQAPFKQKNTKKRILNDNSTQSNVRVQNNSASGVPEPQTRRSQSGFNPPGLTARKFDFISPQRAAEMNILDSSLESKDFENAISGSATVDEIQQYDARNHSFHGGVNISLPDRVGMGGTSSQYQSMMRAKIKDKMAKPRGMSQQMAPFRASMDAALQRAYVFTPEKRNETMNDTALKLNPQSKQNYVSVMQSMTATPQSSDLDNVFNSGQQSK